MGKHKNRKKHTNRRKDRGGENSAEMKSLTALAMRTGRFLNQSPTDKKRESFRETAQELVEFGVVNEENIAKFTGNTSLFKQIATGEKIPSFNRERKRSFMQKANDTIIRKLSSEYGVRL